MKRIYHFVLFSALLLVLGCSKEDLWNQHHSDPQARIIGTLLHDEDGTPLKGVKILFERQTDRRGGYSYIDTVSTDTDGSFTYPLPFPNKVRMAIRDTGRYAVDTAVLEITESKDYTITLSSHPKFGVSSIYTQVVDPDDQGLEGLSISLWVRESLSEPYSFVEDQKSDTEGKVIFDDLAFPVFYKVVLSERPEAYKLDSLAGSLLTKEPLELTLHTEAHFGRADLRVLGWYYYPNFAAKSESATFSIKSILDDDFSDPVTIESDQDGYFILPDVIYPAEIKVHPSGSTAFPFSPVSLIVDKDNFDSPLRLHLFDTAPRYADTPPSLIKGENTVETLYDSGDALNSIELDSKGNIYGVTSTSLIRFDPDGNSRTVLHTGFTNAWGLALQNDSTFYVVENTGAHTIQKVTASHAGGVQVSLFSGTFNSPESASAGSILPEVDVKDAKYNRPAEAVYDKKRHCLWVTEWAGQRLRKIDLNTHKVSTAALSGRGYFYSLDITSDYKSLYIGSHTGQAGLHRYDIDDNKIYVVRSGYSIRQVAVAPSGRVFFGIHGAAYTVGYTIANEILVEANGTSTANSQSEMAQFAGLNNSGAGGRTPDIGERLNADGHVFQGSAASDTGTVTALAYDPFRGRLYMSNPPSGKLMFVRLSAIYQ